MSAQTSSSNTDGLGFARGAQAAWRGANVATRVALALGGGVLILAALAAWPAARAVIGPRVTLPERPTAQASSEVAGQFTQLRAEIDGRSLFIVPGPPVNTEPEPPAATETANREPPKPTSYAGPGITAMVNDTVWFRDGKRLVAGAEASGDLSVVRVNGPWDAVVMWKGVEFTVPLFGRDKLVLKDAPKTATPSPVPETPAAPSDTPTTDDSPSDEEAADEAPASEKPASEDGTGSSPSPSSPSSTPSTPEAPAAPAKPAEPAPASGG